MKWEKKGFIFNAENMTNWAISGAMIPTPIIWDENTIRIFLTFLDKEGIGRTGFVDLDKINFSIIKDFSKNPIFDIGQDGTFDENGSLTCSVTKSPSGYLNFYYAGFELGTKIRYRLLTGLAITDKDLNLIKKFETPVLERTSEELFFRGGPFCIYDTIDQIYKMWYVAGSDWTDIDGKQMPVYEIRYLESDDGINWPDKGQSCIKIEKDNEHGFGRPYVIKHQGIYKMFYSIRVKHLGYRLGYAESSNGINWCRKDELMNLDVSFEGWDSEMIAYSSVIDLDGKLIMFYNGNGFGKTGFGYAELVQ
jgi:hypothetical protein